MSFNPSLQVERALARQTFTPTPTELPELDWWAIQSQCRQLYPMARGWHEWAGLALYIHLTKDTNPMSLIYAGFDPTTVQKALQEFRQSLVLQGQILSREALLGTWPKFRELLEAVERGSFNRPPVIKTSSPRREAPLVAASEPVLELIPEPTPTTMEETQPMDTFNEIQPEKGKRKYTRKAGLPKDKAVRRTKEPEPPADPEYDGKLENRDAELEAKKKAEGELRQATPEPQIIRRPFSHYSIVWHQDGPDGPNHLEISGSSRADFESNILMLANSIRPQVGL